MKRDLLSCAFILYAATMLGCSDDSSGSPTPKDEDLCSNIHCHQGETCSEGKCFCGDNVCSSEETCKNGECTPNENSDPCENITCDEDEFCSEGKCLCGDKVCAPNEICSDGNCLPSTPAENLCGNAQCSASETCINDECRCGDDVCQSGQICTNDQCVDETTPEDEDEICYPACGKDEICNTDGTCEPMPAKCDVECSNGTECINGNCESVTDTCDNSCDAGLTCVDGQCLCGSEICSTEQSCVDGKCKWNDPCHDVTCKADQICVNGKCQILAFSPSEMDVMMSSLSPKLVAHKSGTAPLTWSISSNLVDWMIICKSATEKNKYITVLSADNLKNCIVYDDKAKTESIQFVGIGRKGRDLTLTVKEGTKTAEATLHLKPYFDMDTFFNMRKKDEKGNSIISTNRKLNYRNNLCPGNYLQKYNASSETKEEYKANLGGQGNDYGRKGFSSEDTAIFDNDIYEKYVKPKMLYKDGSYYGTRASVVAAARFLILQFPYDIPYQMASLNWSESARSHYIWSKHKTPGKSLREVAIYGLNLDKNAFNSRHEAILTNVVPWGAEYTKTNDKDKDRKYHFNGLKCSGFVTWSFRNGRLGLGSWNSSMMANQGFCDIGDKRNFRCKELVNNTTDNEKWGKSTSSNQNNVLNAAYSKLNKLKEDDFIPLIGLSEAQVKKTFKDLKAGDLLWRGKYTIVMASINETIPMKHIKPLL